MLEGTGAQQSTRQAPKQSDDTTTEAQKGRGVNLSATASRTSDKKNLTLPASTTGNLGETTVNPSFGMTVALGVMAAREPDTNIGLAFRQFHEITEPYSVTDHKVAGEFSGMILVRNKVEAPVKRKKGASGQDKEA